MWLLVASDLAWWRWADARMAKLQRCGGRRLLRALLGCFMASMALYLLCFMVAPHWVRQSRNPVPVALHATVYVWHLLVMPLSSILLLLGCVGHVTVGGLALLRGRLKPGHKAVRRSGASSRSALSAPAAEPDSTAGLDAVDDPESADSRTTLLPAPSRRQVLRAAVAAVPPVVTAGLVGRSVYQLDRFRIRHTVVPVPGLPADLDGLTIAQVSDVHIGKLTRPKLLPRLIEATNALRADLVVLTGDLIDMSINDLPMGIDFVHQLQSRHGREFLAMIEGNHDLFDNPLKFYREVKSGDIPLLLDEAMTLRVPGRRTPVQLLGLRWSPEGNVPNGGAGGRRGGEANIAPAMARLLPQRDPAAFAILLAHHPHAFDPAAAAGIPLTLAGHTHGGQVMLTPHFGPGSLIYRYYSGLYRKGNAHCFVSNGVGNWFPLRINAPAEVVHLTLRRA